MSKLVIIHQRTWHGTVGRASLAEQKLRLEHGLREMHCYQEQGWQH